MDEKKVTAETQEAEKLAQALEDPASAIEVEHQDLAAAGLLRRAGQGGQLATDRQQAVWDKIDATIAKDQPRPDQFGYFWWLGMGTAIAGLVVLMMVWVLARSELGLPSPSVALLQAQSVAASGSVKHVATLANQMNQYRREMYAVLEKKYEGPR